MLDSTTLNQIRLLLRFVPQWHPRSYLFLALSCYLASCHSLTCDSFVCNMHFTRANIFLSLHMDVHTWNHDLVEVRYTHVRDIISHCKHITRAHNMANTILYFSLPMARRCLRSGCRVPDACNVYESAILSQSIFKIKSHSIAYGSNSHKLKARRTRTQITQKLG